jgi:rubrerythrin
MAGLEPLFTPTEHREWQRRLAEANRNNVFCHCRQCGYEWVASAPVPCSDCGAKDVEFILCWQFPDG